MLDSESYKTPGSWNSYHIVSTPPNSDDNGSGESTGRAPTYVAIARVGKSADAITDTSIQGRNGTHGTV